MKEIERIKKKTVKATQETNELLQKYGTNPIYNGTKMSDLLKRTELNYEKLKPLDKDRPNLSKQEAQEVEIQVKYEGYIKMQEGNNSLSESNEQHLHINESFCQMYLLFDYYNPTRP